MNPDKLFFILLSFITVLILTSCNEDSINHPNDKLNDITNPPGGYINKFAINSQGSFFVSNSVGIFRSIDEGSTWEQLPLSINGLLHVYDIEITEDDFIFALSYFVSSGSIWKIIRSTDNGNTWTELSLISDWLTAIETDSYGDIYACGRGIFKSTDKGNTWEEFYDGNVYNICFPKDSTVVIGISGFYVGEILYSTNGGNDWQSTGYFNDLITFYYLDSIIFAGCNNGYESGGGISKSTDWGASWNSVALYERTPVGSFVSNSLNQVLSGSFLGIHLSTDKGETWQNVLLDSVVTTLMRDRKGFIYAGTSSGTFLRSTDNGISWHN